MGKQYKELTTANIEFIESQKLFYIASCSNAEVNLSPKGYECIRVLDNKTLLYLDYPGSGNRTHRDMENEGEFTLLFNAYEGKAMILRAFCSARVVPRDSEDFVSYCKLFDEKESIIRNFFVFDIYGVESSCGEAIPFMEYKGERDSLKSWAKKLDENGKLESYIEDHLSPPNMKEL